MSSRHLFASILMAGLLVLGIGEPTSYLGDPPEATGSGGTISSSLSRSGSDGEMLARLKEGGCFRSRTLGLLSIPGSAVTASQPHQP